MRPSVLSLRFRSWSQSPKTCILYPNTFMPWKTGNSGHDRHRCRAKSCLFSLSHMQWKKFPDKADQHNTSFAPFSLRGSKSPLAYLTTQMPWHHWPTWISSPRFASCPAERLQWATEPTSVVTDLQQLPNGFKVWTRNRNRDQNWLWVLVGAILRDKAKTK